MRIQEIMHWPVKTIDRGAPIEAARGLMRVHRIRHLVVLDGAKIAGVVSDRDLGGPRAGYDPHAGIVEDYMVEDIVTVRPATKVREAANLMRGNRIGCLPVLDKGRLIGIVTDTDLLAVMGCGVVEPAESAGPVAARPHAKSQRARKGHSPAH